MSNQPYHPFEFTLNKRGEAWVCSSEQFGGELGEGFSQQGAIEDAIDYLRDSYNGLKSCRDEHLTEDAKYLRDELREFFE